MKTIYRVALFTLLLLGLPHLAHAQGPGQGGSSGLTGYGGYNRGGMNSPGGQGNGFQGGNQGGAGNGFNGGNNGPQQAMSLKLPEGVFKIYALQSDNSLVIVATPEGYRRVMAFLRSLGVVHSSYRLSDFDGNSFQVTALDGTGTGSKG